MLNLLEEERAKGGALDIETKVVTGITAYPAGYIVADHPSSRPSWACRRTSRSSAPCTSTAASASRARQPSSTATKSDPTIIDIYTNKRKTHNQGVFDVYKPEMRACRSAHIITGLPDGYGRGRIIGDYRRVALYGRDFLIRDKEAQKAATPAYHDRGGHSRP